ncbi:hypothetical protein BOTBODRAFT_39668 [Botryobasidium botryosum FD-172 SS1]|uniref:Peptide hydrolase n=1 Tax=Botryobasidium botryosum (strain FD-172 SS1) TaxID=930990 RepID=A0A067LSW6_BOTB1|nr:hypothetical protein BOTBODRAFT_39668 [Botryobasidium botryosum FD-172 SS1]
MMKTASLLLLLLAAEAYAYPSNYVLVTQSTATERSECLSTSYFGSYGRPVPHKVYFPAESCYGLATSLLESGAVLYLSDDDRESRTLLWVQEAGVDDSARGDALSFSAELDRLAQLTLRDAHLQDETTSLGAEQVIMSSGSSTTSPAVNVIYRDSANALISVPSHALPYIDALLPRLFVPIALPFSPLPQGSTPVPSDAVHRVQKLLTGLRFSPIIASIIDSLSINQMKRDIRWLTGEDGEGPLSRHSFSRGALEAADWIQRQFEKTGARCEQKPFLQGFAPNVVCRYPSSGKDDSLVVLSAHYDSRGSFGSTRAPGGDDDGSGVIHLLAIARSIFENKVTFKSNVELIAFAGEEQGLLGSRAYAKELKAADTNVTLMIQADMLAYHSPSEPAQVGFPDIIGLPEATYLVGNITNIYSPELTVGYTPACCSDHQSFHEVGYPSTWVFERAGSILDPMYHNSGDISNRTGYDFKQVQSIAKATFATLLEVAGFEIEEEDRQ